MKALVDDDDIKLHVRGDGGEIDVGIQFSSAGGSSVVQHGQDAHIHSDLLGADSARSALERNRVVHRLYLQNFAK